MGCGSTQSHGESDGADPTGAGRGHRLTARAGLESREELLYLLGEVAEFAALGGAPRFGRHNLPQRSPYAPEIRLTPAPFSEPTLQRFLHIEQPEGMDISTMAGQLERPGRRLRR